MNIGDPFKIPEAESDNAELSEPKGCWQRRRKVKHGPHLFGGPSGDMHSCQGFAYARCRFTSESGDGWCGEEAPFVVKTRDVVNGIPVASASVPACAKHKAQHQQSAAAARNRSRKAG